jgi:hypothetical protein
MRTWVQRHIHSIRHLLHRLHNCTHSLGYEPQLTYCLQDLSVARMAAKPLKRKSRYVVGSRTGRGISLFIESDVHVLIQPSHSRYAAFISGNFFNHHCLLLRRLKARSQTSPILSQPALLANSPAVLPSAFLTPASAPCRSNTFTTSRVPLEQA